MAKLENSLVRKFSMGFNLRLCMEEIDLIPFLLPIRRERETAKV